MHPWGLAFLPDGRLLVTERPGRVRLIDKDGRLSAPLAGVPKVYASGQGGLLDVQLAPDFATSGAVYLSYAEPRDGSRNGTSLARGKLVADGAGGRLEDVKVIFRQEPSYASSNHFGSRIVFTRDGSLFLTLGDRYSARDEAQNPANHLGKLVRMTAGRQPLCRQPEASRLAAGDLVDRPPQRAGRRAPPAAPASCGRSSTARAAAMRSTCWRPARTTAGRSSPTAATTPSSRIGEGTAKPGMEQPIYYWDPSIAPSGAAFYTGDRFPEWKGNLFVGALAGQALHRLVLDGERLSARRSCSRIWASASATSATVPTASCGC